MSSNNALSLSHFLDTLHTQAMQLLEMTPTHELAGGVRSSVFSACVEKMYRDHVKAKIKPCKKTR